MKIIVHIGNPKAWSTSIQSMLVESEGDDYRYLGFRPSRNKDNWYENKLIAELFNFDLRFTQTSRFRDKCPKYKSYIENVVAKCLVNNQDLWISSENISTRFILEDIDPVEKLIRLQEVLPGRTTFIIIFRNIWESLRSIYFEYIKLGYTKTFAQFTDETFLFREANFLFSLFPGNLISQINKILINNNKLRWHFISSENQMAEVLLLEFLSSFRSKLKFSNIQQLNVAEGRNLSSILRELFAKKFSTLDASGLIENHRAFWHLNNKEQKLFDSIIWDKLRRQKEIRKMATEANRDEKNQLNVSKILLKFIEEFHSLDKKMLITQTELKSYECYEDLWIDKRQ